MAGGSPVRLIMIMIAGALGVALAAGCQSPRSGGVPSPAAVVSSSTSSNPAPTPDTPDGPDNVPRIFIAGDSIASIYPDTFRPRAGWGQALPLFVSPEVRISDRAIPGASSKSFQVRGSLDQILQAIRPGDYLLIAFGHNDERDKPELHTDPGSTFESALRAYIIGARSRGAIPILLTPVERRQFDSSGAAVATHGPYPTAIRALGVAEQVPVIDLQQQSLTLWGAVGPSASIAYFLHVRAGEFPTSFPDGVDDDTHLRATGAIEIARMVARGLADQPELRPYVRNLSSKTLYESAVSWPQTDSTGAR